MSVKRKGGIIMGAYLTGQLAFVLSSIFKESFTDFQKGFCNGFALIAILFGLTYACLDLVHKRISFKY